MHIDACCGSAGKSTEQTSPFWKKSEKKRDFWSTFNDGNCSFLGTRRERTTCARRSFMAGSVVRNEEVVQEGDGQTTSETGWDHRSQNAQKWHRNENYGEQWCRWAKSSTFINEDDLVQSVVCNRAVTVPLIPFPVPFGSVFQQKLRFRFGLVFSYLLTYLGHFKSLKHKHC